MSDLSLGILTRSAEDITALSYLRELALSTIWLANKVTMIVIMDHFFCGVVLRFEGNDLGIGFGEAIGVQRKG